MNIYLDIDGVLLANENNRSNYSEEFIEFIVSNYEVYWLTTHCMDGNANTPIQHIKHLFNPKTVQLMKQIKGTTWVTAKTEAIDYSKPFIWFDDDLYPEEREVLIRHNALDNRIEVDLKKNENQLADFIRSFPISVS